MTQARKSIRGTLGPALAAFLGLLLACPHGYAASAGCEIRALRAQQAIPAARLANWQPVDDRTLLVWTLHDSRAHLVTLDHAIPGLRDAPTVYLITRDHDPNVNACGRDGVIVPGAGTARIISIRYLSHKRTLELDAADTDSRRPKTTFT
jgi:hypothetical protein